MCPLNYGLYRKEKNYWKRVFLFNKNNKLPNNKNKKIRTYIRSGETKNISLLYSEKKNELIKKEIQIRNEIIYKNNFKNPIPYEIELKNSLIQNKISLLNKYQRNFYLIHLQKSLLLIQIR